MEIYVLNRRWMTISDKHEGKHHEEEIVKIFDTKEKMINYIKEYVEEYNSTERFSKAYCSPTYMEMPYEDQIFSGWDFCIRKPLEDEYESFVVNTKTVE